MSYAAIHPNWEKPRSNMVDGYSLEMTAKELDGLREAAPLIRPNTQIAVTFLPGEEIEQRVEAAVLVRELGFEPIVHLSARRLQSEEQLDSYLRDITTKAGVKRVFVIAGDPPEPEGPYENSLQIIESGLLEKHGIEIVGVGPMTISCLLANTVQAAAEQLRGGAHADSKIDWDQLPDRSMIGGTAEA